MSTRRRKADVNGDFHCRRYSSMATTSESTFGTNNLASMVAAVARSLTVGDSFETSVNDRTTEARSLHDGVSKALSA
jgi:hypothetical protein